MSRYFNTEIDIELEYKGEQLEFQMVSVTGVVHSCPATYWEPGGRCITNLRIDMTAQEVQDCVFEDLLGNNKLPPPWVFTDGEVILVEMLDKVETLIDQG